MFKKKKGGIFFSINDIFLCKIILFNYLNRKDLLLTASSGKRATNISSSTT